MATDKPITSPDPEELFHALISIFGEPDELTDVLRDLILRSTGNSESALDKDDQDRITAIRYAAQLNRLVAIPGRVDDEPIVALCVMLAETVDGSDGVSLTPFARLLRFEECERFTTSDGKATELSEFAIAKRDKQRAARAAAKDGDA